MNEVLQSVQNQASRARVAQKKLEKMSTDEKDALLQAVCDELEKRADEIEIANAIDMSAARAEGMSQGLLDRLLFNKQRVLASVQGMRAVIALPDPVGQVVRGINMDNGMRLIQSRVPMGVVAMIYEARPNVTLDVIALALKSGNAIIVRGGHAAIETNAATLRIVHDALHDQGMNPDIVSSVDEFGREGAQAMMKARGFIDLLVPRGSASLIQYVADNATVPIIETGAGNVHIYVDESADFTQAIPIIINSKTQRIGVCNAAEKLLVHEAVAQEFLPLVAKALEEFDVELRTDERAYTILSEAGFTPLQADDEDWDTEYLDYILGVRVVRDMQEAIDHINTHSTHHTEAIISQNYEAIEEFTRSIDSAVIMVNASTRFTDGSQFGFGAELGISTQKMHARGPMGLQELTTTHWVGYGTGQVRK
ncbi:glutamate-5-semialdehyde dehydrogenase [Alloscardovia theropitheci]|uniref:Gamma-glutamyl phosphate reductase n=1 Tax=Alloscardovia theropitheci TaxID=2496842 RepID=A0A4R0QN09_9BIFI|nr:glutamate-5-semialdehyde dehydrogenase [Alloscardovia theropitheci]TCD53562.1 glutamate-5-semialdehyde dehydrogenase [Alloscardovia theropitheci]